MVLVIKAVELKCHPCHTGVTQKGCSATRNQVAATAVFYVPCVWFAYSLTSFNQNVFERFLRERRIIQSYPAIALTSFPSEMYNSERELYTRRNESRDSLSVPTNSAVEIARWKRDRPSK